MAQPSRKERLRALHVQVRGRADDAVQLLRGREDLGALPAEPHAHAGGFPDMRPADDRHRGPARRLPLRHAVLPHRGLETGRLGLVDPRLRRRVPRDRRRRLRRDDIPTGP